MTPRGRPHRGADASGERTSGGAEGPRAAAGPGAFVAGTHRNRSPGAGPGRRLLACFRPGAVFYQ